jgi:hypothetical protein
VLAVAEESVPSSPCANDTKRSPSWLRVRATVRSPAQSYATVLVTCVGAVVVVYALSGVLYCRSIYEGCTRIKVSRTEMPLAVDTRGDGWKPGVLELGFIKTEGSASPELGRGGSASSPASGCVNSIPRVSSRIYRPVETPDGQEGARSCVLPNVPQQQGGAHTSCRQPCCPSIHHTRTTRRLWLEGRKPAAVSAPRLSYRRLYDSFV